MSYKYIHLTFKSTKHFSDICFSKIYYCYKVPMQNFTCFQLLLLLTLEWMKFLHLLGLVHCVKCKHDRKVSKQTFIQTSGIQCMVKEKSLTL